MPLGLAFGTFVVLASIVGFVHYAVRTPGLQTPAYLWGLANGIFLFSIVPKIPVLGPWVAGAVEYIVSPPIPKPDWLTEDMIGWLWPLVVGLGVYLYVKHILGWRPRISLGAGSDAPGGALGAGRPQRVHQ